MTIHARPNRRHRGQVLIIFAAASVLLIGFLALAIDVGFLLAERRSAQNAADSAALAVASAYLSGVTNQSTLDATAAYYAAQNGIDEAPTVTLLDGGERVRVEVRHEAPTFFLRAVYSGDWQVSTHAVAALEPEPKDYALLALKQSGNPIHFNGNVDINVVGGGTMSNGGIACVGNGALTSDLTTDAHTTMSETGNCDIIGLQGRGENRPIVKDPLRNVPEPPVPETPEVRGNVSCTKSGNKWTCPPGALRNDITESGNNWTIEFVSLPGQKDHQFIKADVGGSGNNGTLIFNPGTYYFSRSSIRLTGNNMRMVFNPGEYTFYMVDGSVDIVGNPGGFSASTRIDWYFKDSNVNFVGNTNTSIPPGIYYFDGQGPRLTGNQKVSGQDVFFYFANGASWDTVGNTGYDFRASETPLYPGMLPGLLMFSARDNETTFKMTGNSGAFLRGVVYLPAAELQMVGNSSGTWAEGQLIVSELSNVGNTDVDVKYKKYVDVNVPAVYLVE